MKSGTSLKSFYIKILKDWQGLLETKKEEANKEPETFKMN